MPGNVSHSSQTNHIQNFSSSSERQSDKLPFSQEFRSVDNTPLSPESMATFHRDHPSVVNGIRLPIKMQMIACNLINIIRKLNDKAYSSDQTNYTVQEEIKLKALTTEEVIQLLVVDNFKSEYFLSLGAETLTIIVKELSRRSEEISSPIFTNNNNENTQIYPCLPTDYQTSATDVPAFHKGFVGSSTHGDYRYHPYSRSLRFVSQVANPHTHDLQTSSLYTVETTTPKQNESGNMVSKTLDEPFKGLSKVQELEQCKKDRISSMALKILDIKKQSLCQGNTKQVLPREAVLTEDNINNVINKLLANNLDPKELLPLGSDKLNTIFLELAKRGGKEPSVLCKEFENYLTSRSSRDELIAELPKGQDEEQILSQKIPKMNKSLNAYSLEEQFSILKDWSQEIIKCQDGRNLDIITSPTLFKLFFCKLTEKTFHPLPRWHSI